MFFTEKVQDEWAAQAADLLDYYSSVQRADFSKSSDCIQRLAKLHESRLKALNDSDSDCTCNDYYLFGVLLNLLEEYANFWCLLLASKFSDSWSKLQDIQGSLRMLRKFGSSKDVALLDVIEEQCLHLEKLYPYKVFSSIEATYDQLECSVCGENMNSLRCPHIKGELYRGLLAVGIVREVRELHAVALVENPRDKRCVVQYPERGPQFHLVRYLSSLIRDSRMTPFGFVRVEEKRIEVTAEERKHLSRNGRCPCGSGKKYKKCCIRKLRVEKDHLDLVGVESGIVEPNHVVDLANGRLTLHNLQLATLLGRKEAEGEGSDYDQKNQRTGSQELLRSPRENTGRNSKTLPSP